MNVLMVGVGPKRVGGMWTVANEYINFFAKNPKVNLFYVPTSTNGNKVVRFMYMLLGYIKIIWILNKKEIDIIHIHMAEKGSTFRKGKIAKWGNKKKKKIIIHLHAGSFMSWYESLNCKKKNRIKEILNCADRVLVLGEYWRKQLSEIISINKITVVYNGVDCIDVNPYNPNSRDIVYFGVMKKEKGIYDLIDAIWKIDAKLPKDIKVILCGNDLEGNISTTIIEKGLRNRFQLLGWVEGEDKERVYSNAMISVLPSYYEGLSMTVIEAMARGIPVVTTNISTMPELLAGIIEMITPGDIEGLSCGLLALIEDKEKRTRISQLEFSRACCEFSVKTMIDETLAVYDQLYKEIN